MIKVSAPGKVHLIGEHAIVYGEPSILAAIGKRVFIEVEKSDKMKIHFKYDSGSHEDEASVEYVKAIGKEAKRLYEEGLKTGDFSRIFELGKGNKFGWVSIGYLMNKLGIDSGISVKIDQQIPLGSGLGSSSAYNVAIAFALSKLFEKDDSFETINQMAFELEQFKHGTPSGGDNSTSAFGGLVWFQKGDPNIIKSLKEEIPHELENFVLAYIKKPEKTTGELVSQVRSLEENFRNERMAAIGKATLEMKEALKQKNTKKISEMMNLAWKNLSELGLSVPEADGVISKIKEAGGAAKLCGACGGGIMLAYHEDKDKLKNIIMESGFEPWETELGTEGVKVET
jgi:mevalonate kinase